MRARYFILTAAALMMFMIPLFSNEFDDIQIKKLTMDRMKLLPVPSDNINYFFMQSIENETDIIIGDFSGLEKKIIMIVDDKSDNTIDTVFEYYPQTKVLKKGNSSQSKFFITDMAKLKKDIIEGSVYKGNFTDNMKSLRILENVLTDQNTNNLYADVYGFNVKLFESDERHKNSALFSYGKNEVGYYLQFKTEYYRKTFNTVQKPVLKYSVYCRNSNDPVVKETVENLFKIRQPELNTAKAGR